MRRHPHDGKNSAMFTIRNSEVLATDIAVNPNKTSGQNTAIKKRAQFSFHKLGNYTPALLLPVQKGLDVFGHHLIKNGLFRMARAIFKSGFADVETLDWK
jgi:hypothetical protein